MKKRMSKGNIQRRTISTNEKKWCKAINEFDFEMIEGKLVISKSKYLKEQASKIASEYSICSDGYVKVNIKKGKWELSESSVSGAVPVWIYQVESEPEKDSNIIQSGIDTGGQHEDDNM